jgi:hypothetical protein
MANNNSAAQWSLLINIASMLTRVSQIIGTKYIAQKTIKYQIMDTTTTLWLMIFPQFSTYCHTKQKPFIHQSQALLFQPDDDLNFRTGTVRS